MCPRGEFKILWASEESVGYEIRTSRSGSKGELSVGIPKAVSHLYKEREKVRVILEKMPEQRGDEAGKKAKRKSEKSS